MMFLYNIHSQKIACKLGVFAPSDLYPAFRVSAVPAELAILARCMHLAFDKFSSRGFAHELALLESAANRRFL